MTDPRKIRIEDYTYELPDEKIARFPLENRDESKLLIYNDGNISESVFKNIVDFIPENSLLVFNDTKVIQARIVFERAEAKPIEILCLEPYQQSTEQALQSKHTSEWTAMVGNLRRWKHDSGEIISRKIKTDTSDFTLSAEYIKKDDDNHIIRFTWDSDITFSEVLSLIGEMPIPPYLKRSSEESDRKRYQTVYADPEGSVAAPTAGLHFTEEILSDLKQKGIRTAKVTLHVGAGTFKPVKSEFLEDHHMHREFASIPLETIDLLLGALESEQNIICVGTTSLRTIESIPYLAEEIGQGLIKIGQWEPYIGENIPKSAQNALKIIQNHLKTSKNIQISFQTGIIIVPGFEFSLTNCLITNFHQSQSTLLLLVSAFIGQDWRKVYDYALSHSLRFLSYGDSSILFKN
jgi:S-adenosylmethionine:tRNA ribosyltransferase-isomerase